MKQTNEIYESTNDQSFKDFKEKVIKGLQLSYQRMIEEKKRKKSYIVIMRDGKITKVNWDEL